MSFQLGNVLSNDVISFLPEILMFALCLFMLLNCCQGQV